MLNIARRLLAAAALAAAAPALADDIPPLAPGQQMVLANYYELSATGCRALNPPRVVITQQPALGKLIVVRTRGTANTSSPRCAVSTMSLPISQVLYQADKPGLDTMAWAIKFQARVGPRGKDPRIEYGNARLQIKPGPAR
ncbi:MAG TPA: hypothetical protein VGC69_12740 [Bordetella sp.]